ncbi:MAG: two-component system sensor histidine kinase AtoS [Firmicutes bacterium]|nr:two-component system sensor histidine kinase AtoS [Bacillota bacterium]
MSNISFGNRLFLFTVILLILPILLTGYMLHIIGNSELSLVKEQKAKLNHAAYLFEQQLGGSLDGYLAREGVLQKSKEEQMQAIHQRVSKIVKTLNKDYPELHIGIYHKRLDVFFDGSGRFSENFSRRRKGAFSEVLSTGKSYANNLGGDEKAWVEVYKPFSPNGEVEGVIRSAENLGETGYYGKRESVANTVYAIIVVTIMLGLGGSLMMFRQFVNQVQSVTEGVQSLKNDLGYTVPKAPGELGEIVDSVNDLARKILELNIYNDTMLATIEDALLVVDVNGNVVIANCAAQKLFELPGENKGLPYNDVLPKNSPFINLLDETLEKETQYADLNVSWASSNGVLELIVSTDTLKNGTSTIGAVILCRDITEHKKLEEQVHRQERLASLGKLVAGVAHEIRNPLTSISCYIQHWQDNKNPSAKALATMSREVARLDGIVNQLLYFTKPAEAKFSYHDINLVINGVLGFIMETYQGKYNVVKTLDHSLPPAWIDREQIERVFSNILFNSLQAMPQGGTIKVGTYRSNNFIGIDITDTGCGIAQEHMVHLFDPFYSARPKGTGLGLAIAHEIISAHGGHIEVDSEIGKGTTFSLYVKAGEVE